jgi:hypothetical protein
MRQPFASGAAVVHELLLAHIYIGTLGMEGAFEAMGSGGSQLGEGGSRSLACPTTRKR